MERCTNRDLHSGTKETTLDSKDSLESRGILNHQQECKCVQIHSNTSYTWYCDHMITNHKMHYIEGSHPLDISYDFSCMATIELNIMYDQIV